MSTETEAVVVLRGSLTDAERARERLSNHDIEAQIVRGTDSQGKS